MAFDRNEHRTIWHPAAYIPSEGCIARQRWDDQEHRIDMLDPAFDKERAAAYYAFMMEECHGSSGDAFLLRSAP